MTITGPQLAAGVDASAGAALFEFNPTHLEPWIAQGAQWEMWDVLLAAKELALKVKAYDAKVAALRQADDAVPVGDPNAEHRLGAFELLGVR